MVEREFDLTRSLYLLFLIITIDFFVYYLTIDSHIVWHENVHQQTAIRFGVTNVTIVYEKEFGYRVGGITNGNYSNVKGADLIELNKQFIAQENLGYHLRALEEGLLYVFMGLSLLVYAIVVFK